MSECYKCHCLGHFARECESMKENRDVESSNDFIDRRTDIYDLWDAPDTRTVKEMIADCDLAGTCYYCEREYHYSEDCPQKHFYD